MSIGFFLLYGIIILYKAERKIRLIVLNPVSMIEYTVIEKVKPRSKFNKNIWNTSYEMNLYKKGIS